MNGRGGVRALTIGGGALPAVVVVVVVAVVKEVKERSPPAGTSFAWMVPLAAVAGMPTSSSSFRPDDAAD